MKLEKGLLEPLRDVSDGVLAFGASAVGTHGTYETERFVLRLSAEVHQLVDEAVAAADEGRPISDTQLQAYSTYLHETVHWWQHIGSTAGLMLSLQYPAIAHVVTPNLTALLDSSGFNKPVIKWAELERNKTTSDRTVIGHANTAVNNAFDNDFFRRLVLAPLDGKRTASHP